MCFQATNMVTLITLVPMATKVSMDYITSATKPTMTLRKSSGMRLRLVKVNLMFMTNCPNLVTLNTRLRTKIKVTQSVRVKDMTFLTLMTPR